MMDRLSTMGIAATPLLGSVTQTGETYSDSDHVWLLADIGGWYIAFDWGIVCLDRQHYEGFALTYPELLRFVEQDREQKTRPGGSAQQ